MGRSANRDMVVSASKLTRQTAALVSFVYVSMLHTCQDFDCVHHPAQYT